MTDTSITREEKYLEYLTGNHKGNVPKPVTRRERYLYELCLKGIGGEISPEEIKNAVNEYLEKNPVKPGATAEQAQQIEQNKIDVASLKVETGSLKEDISTKITKFYASSQGENHLSDSDNGKIMDMMVYGKSEQKQYSGRQKFDLNSFTTNTMNGLTATAIVQDDLASGIHISGTLNNTSSYLEIVSKTKKVSLESQKKYKISGGKTGQHIRIREFDESGNVIATHLDSGAGVDFTTLDNLSYCDLYIVVYGTNGQNAMVDLYPMVTLNDENNTDFEPYTGGKPSPSPGYPQEIKSVVNPIVKVCGKNLVDASKVITGDLQDGIVTNGNNYITDYVEIDDSEEYIISGCLKNDYENAFYDENKQFTRRDFNYTIIPQKGEKYVKIEYVNNGDKKIMLEKGSEATSYEPYHDEQTVTLPYTLNAIPVSSGGNVTIDGQQYISDYVDVERGKLVRMVGNINFDNIRYNSKNNTAYFTPSDLGYELSNDVFTGSYVYNNQPTMFNSLSYVNTALSEMKDGTWKISDMLYIKNSSLGSKAEYLSWFNEIGLIGMIMLAEPEEIDLTPEEITAFKALATYYPTTNISINSEQLDGYTVFNYPISMENGWNYVKQQIGDTRDYIYDMDARTQDTDLQAAEAYVNSEYAVALTELEV